MFKKILMLLILLIVVGITVTPLVVSATHNPNHLPPGVLPKNDESGLRGGSLLAFIESSIKVALGIVGAILLILIIYGGFTYATAAGSEERVKKGRQILTYAIIGIVIIAVAWILTDYIIGNILIGNP